MRDPIVRAGKLARLFLSSVKRRRPASGPRPGAELLESRDVPAVMVPTYTLFRPAGGFAPLSSSGPTGTSPSQIRHAYGFDQITFPGGVAGDGRGTTIAIVDAYDDPNIANDLHQFDLRFGLPGPTFTKVNQNGGTSMPSPNGGWIGEIALDVEWAHAIAPGANILLVEANSASDNDLFQAVRTAAATPGVVAVSMSWAGGEWAGETASDSSTFVTPKGHSGVTFIASSGDSGAPALYPSASPNVLSVGGTTLRLDGSGNITAESVWGGSGGGITAYESQPAYQRGIVTQTSTRRATPDVSYDANPSTGFPVYDSYNNGTGAPWVQYGGTSDAAPQWAALIAIADQGRILGGLGALDGPTQALPALYALPSTDFHDITSGSSTGSPNEPAGPGYDLATGLGTPVANRIVADLMAAPMDYNFGTATSPPVGGFAGVTEATAYTKGAFGWLPNSSVQSADRGTGGNLTRDFDFTTTQATFAVDLNNGTYYVTLQLGDMMMARQGMGISFQGQQVDNVSTVAGQIVSKTYLVTVSNGQLDLGLQAMGGLNSAVAIDALEIGLATQSPPMNYDFGTAGSPMAGGFAAVTDQMTFRGETGFGWLPGSDVQSADRKTGTDLTRDFNYTLTQATFAVNLPNGTYTVTLQLGDTVYAHQGMGIAFQGVQIDNLSNAAGQILTRSYTVTVTNGQLDLGLSALGGLNTAAVIEGMEIVSGKPPPPPTQYDFGTISSPVAFGYTAVTEGTTYSPNAGYGWLSGSVASAVRRTGTDLTNDFNYTTASATFAVDLANGTYTVTLQLGDTVYAHQGMGISFQGTQVDNVSTTAGQVLSRTYSVTVTNGQLDLGLSAVGGLNTAGVIEGMEIVPGSPPLQYDFGTSGSAVASGYAAVSEATSYSASTHYGWLPNSSVSSADRGLGTALTRDFNYTFTQATFAVDLANGTYTVTLQLGDMVYAHQGMGVSFQGVQVDNLSNAAGQILTRSYTVTVTNGQLDLGLQALGGLNTAAVIVGMEIAPS
jgi:fibronectin type 3 domain-containing protein